MAAAVADYRPVTVAPTKIKKTPGPVTLEMERTTDILRALGAAKRDRYLVGFAAETDRVLEHARQKRREKNVDLLVSNDVTQPGAGFDGETNSAVLLHDGGETEVPLGSKRALADRIWDHVAAARVNAKQTRPA
jgi:phosphopantothenoylcysteine decarboxylase/phosphopantothenate--cysteine ligase